MGQQIANVDEVRYRTGVLVKALQEFIKDKPEPMPSTAETDGVHYITTDYMRVYTESPAYLGADICDFHCQPAMVEFTHWLLQQVKPDSTVIDVGCSTGFAGLTLAMDGHAVTFHDYEGLALEFIQWFAYHAGIAVDIVPYARGLELPRYDWVLALDVIEHVSNQFAFLRWVCELGDNVALTFPQVGYEPPYIQRLDEWIDADMVLAILRTGGWDVRRHYVADTRTFIVYR